MEFKGLLCVLVLGTLHKAICQPYFHHFPRPRQGEFARKLNHYEIVIPKAVDKHGNFLSHIVRNHKKVEKSKHVPSEDDLHYELSAFGRVFQLQLISNVEFLSPGFVIESGNLIQTRHGKELREFLNCHYVGQVKNETNSWLALSTCNGLKGVIQLQDEDDIFIEPVQDHVPNPDGKHPHMVYKRAAVRLEGTDKRSHCENGGITMAARQVNPNREMEQRRRRSVSTERNVEVLLVADKSMYEFYKNENLKEYLLTVMNMVSKVFRDPSIGAAINIILVRLMILKEDPPELRISHHADYTLGSFCRWAARINPRSEGHPNHHDVAVLITRRDICRGINKPCGTLGVSQINGMCTRDKSCNVNEDSGLSVAYTIAHEIGHNLGMLHDGFQNQCKHHPGTSPYLMSPLLQAPGRQQLWSKCSRNYIRRFLNKGWGWCLNDEPTDHSFRFPVLLPGALYERDHQCRFMYGPFSSYCSGMTDVCNTLWCKVGLSCQSRLDPAADGTTCGVNKWCFKGRCIKRGVIPQSVDGGWGLWSNWTKCSRTCGLGISFSNRLCNNPRPAHGGKYCIGKWKKYKLCKKEDCPPNTPSFREEQCSVYNGRSLRGRNFKWKPKYHPSRPCELHCQPEGHYGRYFSKRFKDQVEDCTPCYPGKRDVCINGKCEHVGCDFVLHSNAKEDKCGVCRGDGTSCETVKSTFNQPVGIGYVETAVIPAGARHIRVEEVAGAPNYLALKSPSGKYYLNGHWYIQWSGEYEAAGTTVHYTRKHNKETFVAQGPTSEEMHIMLLFQTRNPGIKYEYTIPKNKGSPVAKPVFMWRHKDWTLCSASCGIGYQRSEVECIGEDATPVDDKYCNDTTRPDDKQRTCNEDPCPPTWLNGPWQQCSTSCGYGISIRSVLCVRSVGLDEQLALKEEQCSRTKPISLKDCYRRPCPPKWVAFKWGKCSSYCGQGIQRRKVKCSGQTSARKCKASEKPLEWRYCQGKHCPTTKYTVSSKGTTTEKTTTKNSQTTTSYKVTNILDDEVFFDNVEKQHLPRHKHLNRGCKGKKCRKWIVGDWTQCSATCGKGLQIRPVYCPGSHIYCDPLFKPWKERKCQMKPCVAWKAGPWTKCSKSCGVGFRKRTVKCYDQLTGKPVDSCQAAEKPKYYEKCNRKKCPKRKKGREKSCVETGKDKYFCKLVGLHKFCQFSHWRERCCKTCSGTNT